jgi:hypothetical protein
VDLVPWIEEQFLGRRAKGRKARQLAHLPLLSPLLAKVLLSGSVDRETNNYFPVGSGAESALLKGQLLALDVGTDHHPMSCWCGEFGLLVFRNNDCNRTGRP